MFLSSMLFFTRETNFFRSCTIPRERSEIFDGRWACCRKNQARGKCDEQVACKKSARDTEDLRGKRKTKEKGEQANDD